jgi:SET domain-containing protein
MANSRAHQRRLTRVRVSTSPIHGLGLFAVTAFTEDARILPYRGEKITKEESLRRSTRGNGSIFAFNDRYDIDGHALTNTARFANHSCDPNCYTLSTARTIWIVALRDIIPGEELTYNYGYGPEDYAAHPCHCGAALCCGYMLAPRYWGVITRSAGTARRPI